MDDYKVLLGAILDANAKGDIGNQLKAMKDLSVTISKANLDPSVINSIKQQLSKNGIDLTLVFGNQAQILNQAKQTGQQIGNQIQAGIHNVVQKGSFEKIFKADNINNSAKEAENYFKTLSNNVSVLEKFGQNNNLTSFTVSLKNAEGITEQLKYRIDNLKDDAGNITDTFFKYTGGSINDNGVLQQINAISSKADELKIKLEDLKANYSDVNSPKAIKEPEHINALAQQYDKVNNAISSLRGADDSTFSSMQTNIKAEMSALENLISQFRNAEYAATSLRPKDIATIKIDEGHNIDAFVEKMKQSGHYTSELESKVNTLRADLANVFNKESLTNYQNQMSNLQSEFKAVDATAKTLEKDTKLQVNLDSEKSMLIAYGNELKESGVLSDELKAKIQSMYESLGQITTQTGLTTWRAELKGVKADADDLMRSLNEVDKIQRSLEIGDYETRILSYETSLTKLGLSTQDVSSYMNNVNNAFAELKASASGDNIIPDEVIAKAKTLDTEMAKLLNTTKQLKLRESLKADDLSVENTISRLNEQLRKNSAYSKDAKKQIKAWIDEFKKGDVAEARLREINAEAKTLHANMAQLNKIGFSWIDKFKQGFEKIGGWSLISGSFVALFSSLREIPKAVINIDSELTELAKVSDATVSQLDEAFNKSTESAKELGAAVTDVISATADWSRLGYSIPDSEELAKVAILYKNVGDGIDIDTANKSLISTLQGFKLEAKDAINIIDQFNEVANTLPIDTAGIGNALQRSASSFYEANTDLSKSIALITGTNSVVQDPAVVGNMWKTVSMRIRGTKQELEAAGEETDGMVESTSQLRDLIKGLTGFDIMADEAGTKFKDIYQIIVGIGEKWKTLTDVEQAGLLETLAGKRQGNALAAALNNIDMIEEAYATATNSAGSAMREQEKYEESIKYSLDRLSASFQTFANTTLNSNLVKGIVDFGNATINILDTLIDKIGLLPPLIGGSGIAAFVMNLDLQKELKIA